MEIMDLMDLFNPHIWDWMDCMPPYIDNRHNGQIQFVDRIEREGAIVPARCLSPTRSTFKMKMLGNWKCLKLVV